MSYRRRHQWFRRVALGLAFAAVIFAGRVSAAAAESEEVPGGSVYVTAGGWSGLVDAETGIPLSAGIPYGDDRILPEEHVQVISYLSHGILTEEDARAESARALVSRKKSAGRPDGDAIAIKNVLQSRGQLSPAELAFVNSVIGAADSLHDPLTAEPQGIRAETDALLDDEQLRVEHAREAQAQGGLSGHMVDLAEAVIAGAESSTQQLTGDAGGSGGTADEQDQGDASGYLTPQHQGVDYPE
jgi:hypothetical protein